MPRRAASPSPIEVLPLPDTPITTMAGGRLSGEAAGFDMAPSP